MEVITGMPVKVEKETINSLRFPKTDVLVSPEQMMKRKINLQTGLKLGNNYHRKVKIVFEDEESMKVVETTIWATAEKNIALKGGEIIPIHRIHEVRIY